MRFRTNLINKGIWGEILKLVIINRIGEVRKLYQNKEVKQLLPFKILSSTIMEGSA